MYSLPPATARQIDETHSWSVKRKNISASVSQSARTKSIANLWHDILMTPVGSAPFALPPIAKANKLSKPNKKIREQKRLAPKVTKCWPSVELESELERRQEIVDRLHCCVDNNLAPTTRSPAISGSQLEQIVVEKEPKEDVHVFLRRSLEKADHLLSYSLSMMQSTLRRKADRGLRAKQRSPSVDFTSQQARRRAELARVLEQRPHFATADGIGIVAHGTDFQEDVAERVKQKIDELSAQEPVVIGSNVNSDSEDDL